MFYSRVALRHLATQRRLDGTRQLEIIIDGPSYPDPFQSGRLREQRPSVRVTDPNLRNQHLRTAMISVERTFSGNLWMAAMYDYGRGNGQVAPAGFECAIRHRGARTARVPSRAKR